MRDWVSEWVQQGEIFVWRYSKDSRHRHGWHFTGDPAGCRSLRNLLDRMSGGPACHRTLRLGEVTQAIWAVPNFGPARRDKFTSLGVAFAPDIADLAMDIDGERLIMTMGNNYVARLRAAFGDVEVGRGDFGIGTSDKRGAEIWMFWWMPRTRDKR